MSKPTAEAMLGSSARRAQRRLNTALGSMIARESSFQLLVAAQAFAAALAAVIAWAMASWFVDDGFAATLSTNGWIKVAATRALAGIVLSGVIAWLSWRFTATAARLLRAGSPGAPRRVAVFCGVLPAIASIAGAVQFALTRPFI